MLKNHFKKIILTIVFIMFSTPVMAQRSDFNVWLKKYARQSCRRRHFTSHYQCKSLQYHAQ